MCGIAGFVTPGAGSERLDQALRAAVARLVHRGPDDEGSLTSPTPPSPGGPAVGLGCRRLAILDLSASGHQPMVSADGRWALTYNGEIYNYRELRAELAGLGRRFRSASDTEVLLEVFAEWGPGALIRLTGMFAFAIHDRQAGVVYLARDPFGIKPLYYAFDGDTLVFGSEIPALWKFPGPSRTVDLASYRTFLTSVTSDAGDRTFFTDVRRVPAAHYLKVPVRDPRGLEAVRYWKLDQECERDCSFEEAAALVRDAFLESVSLHLRSDVGLGVVLSGGLDSSSIVMAARRLLGPGPELHTFSYIPDDPRIDEERHVDTVVSAAGATGHKLRLSPQELERDIETLTAVQAEPFASPVIYAQHRLHELAHRTGVTVVLGGEGADEIFAGYGRYSTARVASLIRQGRLVQSARTLAAHGSAAGHGSLQSLRSAAGLALPGWLERPTRTWWQQLRGQSRWLDNGWFRKHGALEEDGWSPRGQNVMRAMLSHNLLASQVPSLLRYEDRNAMFFSLENRVPYLTPPLVQLLFSLPEQYLVSPDGRRKAVFRRAMRGLVPDSILDRRDKIGFSVPLSSWYDVLRPWLIRRLRDVDHLPGLEPGWLRRQRQALESGGRPEHPHLIWRCVSVSHWAERFGARFV